MSPHVEVLWGALAMGCLVVALFFLRFWARTRERLFAFFSLSFATLALNWVGLIVTEPASEARHWVYFVRLFAFVVLAAGILDQNRRRR
jgi:hypothetical protein